MYLSYICVVPMCSIQFIVVLLILCVHFFKYDVVFVDCDVLGIHFCCTYVVYNFLICIMHILWAL
jgi:hypothetical protein